MIAETMHDVHVRFSYFGYSAEFATSARSVTERRAEANARVIARFGEMPKVSYVEPGLPFPDYVPMQVWDEQDQAYL